MIVLAIALLLASNIYILMVFSSGSFRHTEKTMNHVRAVYIGESAFARVLARLKSAAWKDRWFKDGPVEERDVALADGTYSSYVGTSDDPTQKLVNVWIQARQETSLAVMYWRVMYSDDTLDFNSQVYPRFFTFLSPDDPTPFDAGLAPSLVFVQNMMDRQRGNETNARALLTELEGIRDFPGIATRLRLPSPADRVTDVTRPLVGAPIAQANILTQIVNSVGGLAMSLPLVGSLPLPLPLPTPPPPATPPPTPTPVVTPTPTPAPAAASGLAQQLASTNPDPFASRKLSDVITAAFTNAGLPAPGNASQQNPYFENIQNAHGHWSALDHPLATPKEIAENASKYLEELGKKVRNQQLTPAQNANAILAATTILDYLEVVLQKSDIPLDPAQNFLDPFKTAFTGTLGSF